MKKALKYIIDQIKKRAVLILSIASIVFFALMLHQCRQKKELKAQSENTAKFLNSEVEYYENELDQEVAKKEALAGKNESLEVLLSKQIDSTKQLKGLVKKFKKVNAAGNITQETIVDTVKISYQKPVEFDFVRKWKIDKEHYFISGRSTNNFTSIDKLKLQNTLSFAIGEQSSGFWKTTYKAEAVNSNPYVKTTGLDTYTYTEQKKRFGIGPYVGIDTNLQPSIGIGLNFNLIRF